jgi:hypothetical protein
MAKNPDFELDNELDLRLRDALLEKAMKEAKDAYNKAVDKATVLPDDAEPEYNAFTAAKLELREFRRHWREIRAAFEEPQEGEARPEPIKAGASVKEVGA